MSKISPKLQKLLVGGTILNNLDRLVDVLEGVKARKSPSKKPSKKPLRGWILWFDESLKMREVQKVSDFLLQHSELDDV